MQEGGQVPSDLDLSSGENLLDSNLQSGQGPIGSDTQKAEKQFDVDFDSLPDTYKEAIGLELPNFSVLDENVLTPNQDDLEYYLSVNVTAPKPVEPTPMYAPSLLDKGEKKLVQPTQKQYDKYNEEVKEYNKQSLEKYNEYRAQFDFNKIDTYEKAVGEYNEFYGEGGAASVALDKIVRSSTPESLNEAYTKALESGMLDLSGLELRESTASFKTKSGEMSSTYGVQLEDILPTTSIDDFKTLVDEGLTEEVIDKEAKKIGGQILEKQNEIAKLKTRLKYGQVDQSEGMLRVAEINEEIDVLKERVDYNPGTTAGQYTSAIKQKGVDELKALVAKQLIEEHVLTNVATGTDNEYLKDLEVKIFKDLMNDKEAYEYAQSLGMQDGTFKLYLDDSVAVGEKNKMYDALLSFEIGLVNLGGTVERMTRPLEGLPIGMAGPMGYDSETAQIVVQQQQDFAQETREERLERYRTEDYSREELVNELRGRQTQYARTYNQLKIFGESAVSNSRHHANLQHKIYKQALDDLEFKEFSLPGVESAPMSLAGMGLGTLATIGSGGNVYVGAGVSSLFMGYGSGVDAYYNSFYDPFLKDVSDSARLAYSFEHGAYEMGGEFVGNLLFLGLGKFGLSKLTTRFDPKNIFKPGSPRFVQAKDLKTGRFMKGKVPAPVAKYSPYRKMFDFTAGTLLASGLGGAEEYVAEGLTGVGQKYAYARSAGLTYTSEEYKNTFFHDARIGANMGFLFGGSGNVVYNGRAYFDKVFRTAKFNDMAALTYLNQLSSSGFFMGGLARKEQKQLTEDLKLFYEGETIRREEGQFEFRTSDLTEEQQAAEERIKELVPKMNLDLLISKKGVKDLMKNGRYSILANMVLVDNRLRALQVLRTEFNKDNEGNWVDINGNANPSFELAEELLDEAAALTEDQRKKFNEEYESLVKGGNTLRAITRFRFYESAAFQQGVGDRSWESGTDYVDVKADDETLSELEKMAIPFVEEGGGEVRIILHRSIDSIQGATGGFNAMYKEATQDERDAGAKDELHIYVGEGANAQQVLKDLVHESGHFAFRDVVNDESKRKEMINSIKELAKENGAVAELIEGINKTYGDYTLENLEKEVINHVMEAVALAELMKQGEITSKDILNGLDEVFKDMTGGFEEILSKVLGQDVDAEGAIKIAINHTNFIREQRIAAGTEKEAQEIHNIEPTIDASKDGRGKKPTESIEDHQEYLEKYADQLLAEDMTEEERAQQEFENQMVRSSGLESRKIISVWSLPENSPFTLSWKAMGRYHMVSPKQQVANYNSMEFKNRQHFFNMYPHITSGGKSSRFMNLNGEWGKWEYTDPATGQVQLVNVEAMHFWNNGSVQRWKPKDVRIKEQQAVLIEELQRVNKIAKDVYHGRDNAEYDGIDISLYFSYTSFFPEVDTDLYTDIGPVREYELKVESANIAIANMLALREQGFQKEDLDNLRGNVYNTKIGFQEQPEVYRLSGLRLSETFQMKADRLMKEVQKYGQPWQLLPKDSESYAKRIPDLRMATKEELDYASERLEGAKEGNTLTGDILNISDLNISGLESRRLGDAGPLIESLREKHGEANIVVVQHLYDRTRAGDVTFYFARPNGEEEIYTYKNQSGVYGLQNINEETNGALSILSAHSVGKPNLLKTGNAEVYLNLFSVTETENVFNSPGTFHHVMKLIDKWHDAWSDKGGDSMIFQAINEALAKVSVSPHMGQVISGPMFDSVSFDKNTNTYQLIDVFESAAFEDLTTGEKAEKRREIIKQFLNIFAGENGFANSNELGFSNNNRQEFLTSILSVKSKLRGLDKQAILDALIPKNLRNAEKGDVVAANYADITGAKLRPIKDVRQIDAYSEYTKDIGFPAVILLEGGKVNYVTFENFAEAGALIPIKRAASRKEIMTVAELDRMTKAKAQGVESRRLGRVYPEGNSQWEKSSPTPYGAALERLALRFQDKFFSVMLLQEDVEQFRDNPLPESQDFKMAMAQMYGMVRTDIEALETKLETIKTMMSDAGLIAEQVSDYMYAKHAPERNKFIFSIRPELESGSGMTNAEAEAIIDELESKEMVEISKFIQGILSETRQLMVSSGLESQKAIDTWESMYDHYVPLSGLAYDEYSEEEHYYSTGGAGMAVYGKTSKSAKGRQSKTGVNLIANIIMQSAMVSQRARKDQAMLNLHELVKNNTNENVWGVFSSKNPKMKIGKDGSMEPMTEFEMKGNRNFVPIRINGEQHFIYFKKKDYADALNGMTTEKLSGVFKFMSGPMNLMRNSFTQYNPGFFVGNFFRDIHGAVYNVMAELENEGGILSAYDINTKDFTKAIIKSSFTTLKVLLNEAAFSREVSPEIQTYVQEWEESGGRTGFSYSEAINDVVENLRKDAETKGVVKQGVEFIFDKPAKFFEYVKGINEAFENSIRLSAYIEARKAGVSIGKAAQLSKEITVNFNRSGEWGPTLNSVFLFFNASVQGLSRFSNTFGGIKDSIPNNPDELPSWKNRLTAPRKLAGGMVLLSALQTMINIALSDRDEDDELRYTKIADYKKERGFLVMVNGENYINVPLGYGYNIFNNAGMMLAEVACGVRDFDDALMFMGLSAQSSFSPIAMGHSGTLGGSAVKSITPTILKAPSDAFAFNETYFGGVVRREQFPFGAEVPESTLAFRSPLFVQDAAFALNEMTGGTENISAKLQGGIDVNPDPYYYILQSYWGGAGDFVEESIGLGRKGLSVGYRKSQQLLGSKNSEEFVNNLMTTKSEDMPVVRFSDVPILKSIYGGPSRFFDYDLYEENKENVLQFEREMKKGTTVREDLDFTGVQRLKNELKQTEEALKLYRKAKLKARDLPYIDRVNAMYEIQEAERKEIMFFNAMYYKHRGQYLDPKPQGLIPMSEIRKIIGTDE
tara:strand:+ start:19601 stop:28237 length:8637 start_codon:yes stop_codon:yes gene_type:complete